MSVFGVVYAGVWVVAEAPSGQADGGTRKIFSLEFPPN